MPEPAIRIERLSKCYQLGAAQRVRPTFREAIVQAVRAPWHRYRRLSGRDQSTPFWALDDVSFDVLPGQVVGIIGRNGAGKSTLLKILSRITAPTAGRVMLRGRVSSLLEVGTGFHPELTGRDNVFLNGAILGMRQAEIRRKFDAIVDFAEVEQFLDTQVKHYSSGMYMRLAFAVAAHLEQEILLVDEVLAVGDAAFQRKCLGKLSSVTRDGRTVIFVSHNMGAISQLCRRALVIENGHVRTDADAQTAIAEYLASTAERRSSMLDLSAYAHRSGNGKARFTSAGLRNSAGQACNTFGLGDDLILEFTVAPKQPRRDIKLAVQLRSLDGLALANMIDADSGFFATLEHEQRFVVSLRDLRFYPGSYLIGLWAGDITSAETFDFVEDCLEFEISGGGKLTARSLPRSAGLLFLTPEWSRA